jgi:predicted CXXCH cytochrome family protein
MQEFNSHKRIFFLCLGVLLLPGWVSPAWSLHENLPCAPCHNKTEEQLKDYIHDSSSFPVSDVCLACHDANMDISSLTPPYVFNGRVALAGGTFTSTLRSDKVGHNIVSVDVNLGLTPPGGAPLSEFGCLSCHDAHQNGNYRNLKKEINGYTTMVQAEGDPDFQQNVYISGMNDFCGACHEKFNNCSGGRGIQGWISHPVGIAISGAEHADIDHWSRLENKVTQAEYPSADPDDAYGAQVFCLSCHRAHASSYPNAMRWDHRKKPRGCLECHTF